MLSFPCKGVEEEAAKYLSEEKEVHTVEEAIDGAKDIIAENVSDDASACQWIRRETFKTGMLLQRLKRKKKMKKMYLKCTMNTQNR